MPDANLPADLQALLSHYGWVQALCLRLVADEADADDVTQQTWVAALEHPPRGEPRSWLAQVARNTGARAQGLGHAVVVGAAQRRAGGIAQKRRLVPGDLGPAAVVAHHGDDRDLMAHEGVEFGQPEPAGAVAPQEPDLALGTAQPGGQGEAGAAAQRPEGARVEPGEGSTGRDDVAGRGHEIAAVGDEDGVVRGRFLDGEAEAKRMDVVRSGGGFASDLLVPHAVALAQGLEPRGPAGGAVAARVGQGPQEERGVGLHGELRAAVAEQVAAAAVRRDDAGPAPDLAAVVEAEVARNPGEDDEVGLAQGLLAVVAHKKRMPAPQQPAGHAGAVGRDA